MQSIPLSYEYMFLSDPLMCTNHAFRFNNIELSSSWLTISSCLVLSRGIWLKCEECLDSMYIPSLSSISRYPNNHISNSWTITLLLWWIYHHFKFWNCIYIFFLKLQTWDVHYMQHVYHYHSKVMQHTRYKCSCTNTLVTLSSKFLLM